MITRYRFIAALLVGLFLVLGCGQKGPLYIPENPTRIKTEVPQQEQAGDEDDEKEKEPRPE